MNPNVIVVAPENPNSFSYRKKHNKPERSLMAGMFLLLGNGCFMLLPFYSALSYGDGYFNFIYNSTSAYLGGVIATTLLTSVLLTKLRKVIHYYLAAILQFIAAALYIAVSVDTYGFYNNANTMSAGSFFAGASFGVTLMTYLTHGADMPVKHLRGGIMCAIQLEIDVGIFIMLVFIQTNFLLATGIVGIIMSIAAVICTIACTKESPIFLLQNNNEREALEVLTWLRNEPNNMTNLIRAEFEDMKIALRSRAVIDFNEILPFIKVLLCRLAVVFGTSLPINLILITLNLTQHTFAGYLHLGRLLGHLVSMFVIDMLGRKIPLCLSLIVSGISLIVMEGMMLNATSTSVFSTAFIFAMINSIFFGLGSMSISYTYMAEMFQHSTRTYMIAAIIIIEYAVHFILLQIPQIVVINSDSNLIFVFLTAAFQVAVGALSFVFMPESKGKTLLEVQQQAKRLITLR